MTSKYSLVEVTELVKTRVKGEQFFNVYLKEDITLRVAEIWGKHGNWLIMCWDENCTMVKPKSCYTFKEILLFLTRHRGSHSRMKERV